MFTDFSKTPTDMFKTITDQYSKLPKTEAEFKEFFTKLQSIFYSESTNSMDIWKTYQKSLSGDATPNEITDANKKTMELMKTAGFATLVAVPGMFFILPSLIEMSNKYGVDLVPQSISKEFEI